MEKNGERVQQVSDITLIIVSGSRSKECRVLLSSRYITDKLWKKDKKIVGRFALSRMSSERLLM